jgi:Maltokinase N-terminal cap domain
MAVIHKTSLLPGKLELLAGWMPAQPWYAGTGREPALAKAGGFRLDDPAGEVGRPCVSATWRLPDGTAARGVFATAQYPPRPPA